jgi:hypothetical protein
MNASAYGSFVRRPAVHRGLQEQPQYADLNRVNVGVPRGAAPGAVVPVRLTYLVGQVTKSPSECGDITSYVEEEAVWESQQVARDVGSD